MGEHPHKINQSTGLAVTALTMACTLSPTHRDSLSPHARPAAIFILLQSGAYLLESGGRANPRFA